MISNIGGMSMQGVQGMQQARPPMPPTDEMIEDGIERLEDNISSGKVDTEELAAKLEERFGEDAEGIVSEDGEVDFDALKDLLVEERNDKVKEGLTERFGEEAANSVFEDDGSINEDALKALMSSGTGEMAPPPPPSGEGEGDFLAEVNGDTPPPPPPGGRTQGMSGSESSEDSTSLESMLQQILADREEASSYGTQGEKQTSIFDASQSLFDILA